VLVVVVLVVVDADDARVVVDADAARVRSSVIDVVVAIDRD